MEYRKLSGLGVNLFFSINFFERTFNMTCRCSCRQKVRLVSSWSSSLLSRNYKFNVHGTLVSSYQRFRSACRTFLLNWRIWWRTTSVWFWYLIKAGQLSKNAIFRVLGWIFYALGWKSYVVVSFYLCFSYYLFITSTPLPLTVDTFLEVLLLCCVFCVSYCGQQTFLLVLPDKLSDISSWWVVKKG